jgi:RNA polymerase sigma-70 factor (ECF subfamily)
MLNKTAELEHKLRVLFQLSIGGDGEAYESFLMMVAALVKRNLQFLGGKKLSQEQLEELQQEVMISIHQKKHTYSLERPLLPWIYAIARYRFIDDYRQKKRLPVIIEWQEELRAEEETSDSLDWEEILAILSPKQREMFVSIKLEGKSYSETASDLDLSVPAVKVGVHRIMKVLKDKVQR